jgi:sugar lactone lactonase YvrE
MTQSSKRIEQLTPELDRIIEISQPIQELADGFGGPQGPAEGPVWWHEGGYLVFSDIHNNRRIGADQPRQWADPRSARTACRLRA